MSIYNQMLHKAAAHHPLTNAKIRKVGEAGYAWGIYWRCIGDGMWGRENFGAGRGDGWIGAVLRSPKAGEVLGWI